MSTITPLHEIDLHRGHIAKPRWSPDGRFLAIPTQSGSIVIFDLDSGQVSQTLGHHAGEVTAVTWDRTGESILSCSLDGSVGLWALKNGSRAPFTGNGHKEPIHSIEWTDEGAFAMTCSADRVRALDGCCLLAGWTEEMEEALNKSIGFTAATCSFRTTFLLAMLAESGALLVLASLHLATILDTVQMKEPARCLAWSPAEDLIAVGAGKRILLFHATQAGFEGSPRELTGHAPLAYALAFSGDGTILASHDLEGLKIWDVQSARLIAAFPENLEMLCDRRPPSGIAFHPTMPLLAVVTPNGNAFRILELGWPSVEARYNCETSELGI
jgi:WD40 repeat protein